MVKRTHWDTKHQTHDGMTKCEDGRRILSRIKRCRSKKLRTVYDHPHIGQSFLLLLSGVILLQFVLTLQSRWCLLGVILLRITSTPLPRRRFYGLDISVVVRSSRTFSESIHWSYLLSTSYLTRVVSVSTSRRTSETPGWEWGHTDLLSCTSFSSNKSSEFWTATNETTQNLDEPWTTKRKKVTKRKNPTLTGRTSTGW